MSAEQSENAKLRDRCELVGIADTAVSFVEKRAAIDWWRARGPVGLARYNDTAVRLESTVDSRASLASEA